MATRAAARPLLLALAVLGGALLVVVGLLLGSALTGSSASTFPDEASVDAGFARDMQVHHGQAVEMSVLVRERSDDPEVRGIALDILLTQQNQQGQMAGWLQTWGLPQSSVLPTMGWMSTFADHDGMTGDMTGDMTGTDAEGTGDGEPQNPMVAMGMATDEEMAALEAADGVEAERLFLQLMIDHHHGGVDMADGRRRPGDPAPGPTAGRGDGRGPDERAGAVAGAARRPRGPDRAAEAVGDGYRPAVGNGKLHSDAVLVVGLGRFGAAAAEALHRLGHEVLAVERSPDLVQQWSGRLTHVVEADATNLQALEQIGAGQFPIAVVGIGTSIEASVLSTLNLVDLKVGPDLGQGDLAQPTARSSSGWRPGSGADHITGDDDAGGGGPPRPRARTAQGRAGPAAPAAGSRSCTPRRRWASAPPTW